MGIYTQAGQRVTPVEKPFSQACENNKTPILAVLQRVFAPCRNILEIGSGTGQHAVWFAPRLAHLHWQTSDLAVNHPGINAWIDEQPASNLARPIVLNVVSGTWPVAMDGVFSANTCHIMPWSSVVKMFDGFGRHLARDGTVAIYGPFNYRGEFTSASNAQFDQWLRQRAPHQGIRDIETMRRLAGRAGLELLEDNPMPANNRLLVWRKSAEYQPSA